MKKEQKHGTFLLSKVLIKTYLVMDKITKILERRKELKKNSLAAKALRECEQIDGSINYVLLNYIYQTGDANEFKTFQEWKQEGFQVKKGEKAFVVWGKPQDLKKEEGEKVVFYPVSYLFSDKQVYKVKEGESPYCAGEVVLTYRKHKDIDWQVIRRADDAFNFIRQNWGNDIELRESFYVIALNQSNRIVAYSRLFTGGISGTVVDVRTIMQLLLQVNASNFIVCHNHPSGMLEPSKQDIETTKKLVEAGKVMDINLYDHLIVSDQEFYSFADNGLI